MSIRGLTVLNMKRNRKIAALNKKYIKLQEKLNINYNICQS